MTQMSVDDIFQLRRSAEATIRILDKYAFEEQFHEVEECDNPIPDADWKLSMLGWDHIFASLFTYLYLVLFENFKSTILNGHTIVILIICTFYVTHKVRLKNYSHLVCYHIHQ